MEGRRAPPKANHPFPDNPDIYKFWGAPYGKAVFKSFGVFIVSFAVLASLEAYLHRNRQTIWGMDLAMTKEQTRKRFEALNSSNFLWDTVQLPVDMKLRVNQMSLDDNMKFDDGIEFVSCSERVSMDPIYNTN